MYRRSDPINTSLLYIGKVCAQSELSEANCPAKLAIRPVTLFTRGTQEERRRDRTMSSAYAIDVQSDNDGICR